MFAFSVARQLMIAAVSVVLPWSTCPVVPMFTCGLLRSNLAFAMIRFLAFLYCCQRLLLIGSSGSSGFFRSSAYFRNFGSLRSLGSFKSRRRSSSVRGLCGGAFLARSFRHDFLLDRFRSFLVMRELHGIRCAA